MMVTKIIIITWKLAHYPWGKKIWSEIPINVNSGYVIDENMGWFFFFVCVFQLSLLNKHLLRS